MTEDKGERVFLYPNLHVNAACVKAIKRLSGAQSVYYERYLTYAVYYKPDSPRNMDIYSAYYVEDAQRDGMEYVCQIDCANATVYLYRRINNEVKE